MQTFSWRVKPLTETFVVLDEHSYIEYEYYLKTLCMFSVRLVDTVNIDKAMRTEHLKIGLNYTEFCACKVRAKFKLNSQLKNFLYQMNTHILSINIISKDCVGLVDICRNF